MGNRMIALIPAYEPDGRILGLAAELRSRGFDIVVVDDGSGPDYREIFEDLSEGAMASNPRTAIGIKADGTYLFVVSDGRTDESEGLSLLELAEFMKSLGAETAYNLDGGGSSTMAFNGSVVNTPTGGGVGSGSGSERKVSDIVYIGY
jgi:exopolysaccharide biosynthesis protein